MTPAPDPPGPISPPPLARSALPLDRVAGLVDRIHDAAPAAPMVALFVAGGGTEAFPLLLARGGGSATLLAGRIPYDPADFRALLGADPGRLVDARAARGLAMVAYRHALRLRPDLGTDGVVGVGATSKLARADGTPERAGRAHEVHLALQTARSTVGRAVALPPGGDRAEQERINALLILNLVAEGRGVAPLPLPPESAGTPVEARADAGSAGGIDLAPLLAGEAPWVAYRLGDRAPDRGPAPRLILPGSFRPLHEGHRRMAELATDLVGVPCAFELSVFHPSKPPLDYVGLAHRVAGFAGLAGARLLLTDAPTYLDKARLFPASTFVVGSDTALRLLEPHWYGGVGARDAMLDELAGLGARFLVFGRVDDSGSFRDLAREAWGDPAVARFAAGSMRFVGEADFRADLSSTALRLALGADPP